MNARGHFTLVDVCKCTCTRDAEYVQKDAVSKIPRIEFEFELEPRINACLSVNTPQQTWAILCVINVNIFYYCCLSSEFSLVIA